MERLVLVWLLLTGGVGGGKASFGVVICLHLPIKKLYE